MADVVMIYSNHKQISQVFYEYYFAHAESNSKHYKRNRFYEKQLKK